MGLADRERATLAALLLDVGSSRPTLCAGWTTGDLLAHLLVRERRPDIAIGMLVPALRDRARAATQRLRGRPYAEQVGLLRGGPPRWNPMGWGRVNELANAAEMLIHHEDVRRGVEGWTPREPDRARDDAVAALLRSVPLRLALRRSPVGITAVMPGRDDRVLHPGSPMVQLHGDPVEVILWLAGRSATRATLHGDDAAVQAAQATSRHL